MLTFVKICLILLATGYGLILFLALCVVFIMIYARITESKGDNAHNTGNIPPHVKQI